MRPEEADRVVNICRQAVHLLLLPLQRFGAGFGLLLDLLVTGIEQSEGGASGGSQCCQHHTQRRGDEGDGRLRHADDAVLHSVKQRRDTATLDTQLPEVDNQPGLRRKHLLQGLFVPADVALKVTHRGIDLLQLRIEQFNLPQHFGADGALPLLLAQLPVGIAELAQRLRHLDVGSLGRKQGLCRGVQRGADIALLRAELLQLFQVLLQLLVVVVDGHPALVVVFGDLLDPGIGSVDACLQLLHPGHKESERPRILVDNRPQLLHTLDLRILVLGGDLHRLVDLLLRLRHSGLRLGELFGPGRQLGEGLFQLLDLLPEFPDGLRAGCRIHLDHSFDLFCHIR